MKWAFVTVQPPENNVKNIAGDYLRSEVSAPQHQLSPGGDVCLRDTADNAALMHHSVFVAPATACCTTLLFICFSNLPRKMIVFGSVAATNASDDKQLLLWLTTVQRLTCSLWNTGNRHRSKHLQNSSQLEVKVPPVWCCRQIYTSVTKTKSWRIWFFFYPFFMVEYQGHIENK